ncbi:hypothetical protein CSUNSWCD_572 [Campylobacter showae CSUNSWCD]|uniref:Uncharacterized protein n=1 Tax=Campylobacter showae CSUNSWCD TaxID=1244083 RepID=M5IPQ5_9BACT|nr:hypothetical protein CSUNSWCD_572 [Campylobacter showae CSUNSWCD]
MKNFFKICKFSLFVWFLRSATSDKFTFRDFYAAQISLNLACFVQI